MQKQTLSGGCHCGAVRFEVDAATPLQVDRCNCSICRLSSYLHLIVPATDFRLLTDPDALTEYRFNSGIARHSFCRTCGIKSFYVPRSNPDGVSVNANCLDDPQPAMDVQSFDGQNWERHAHKLAHKSKPA